MASQRGQVRIIVLVVVFIVLGLGAGLVWHRYRTVRGPTAVEPAGGKELSPSTKAVLEHLDAPVEIRFYSLLDTKTVSEDVQDLASRVEWLLSKYQEAAGPRLIVKRVTSPTDANLAAASADGLRPFNLEKGDASYLGIAVVGHNQEQALPRLSLEWEQAVEPDLSRAIERVAQGRPATQVAASSSETAAAAAADVKQAIPNLPEVSTEEGSRMLREQALKQFQAAAKEMEARVQEAQQRLGEARQSGSAAEQQAAMTQLQQVQAQQAEKLKNIAARLQDQIEALKRLKQK